MSNGVNVPERVTEAMDWYDKASHRNMVSYHTIKSIQIGLAAFIPISAVIIPDGPTAKNIGAICGVLIGSIEALVQTFQFQRLYIKYRSTCEAIRQQKSLFLESAGDYGRAENPRALLVDRVEDLISQEGKAWEAIKEPARDIERPR